MKSTALAMLGVLLAVALAAGVGAEADEGRSLLSGYYDHGKGKGYGYGYGYRKGYGYGGYYGHGKRYYGKYYGKYYGHGYSKGKKLLEADSETEINTETLDTGDESSLGRDLLSGYYGYGYYGHGKRYYGGYGHGKHYYRSYKYRKPYYSKYGKRLLETDSETVQTASDPSV